jgi:hypothetical protein
MNGVPDGDWYEASQANLITPENKTLFTESINRHILTTAATVICAPKVNYLLMNHHVGQSPERNTAVGYVQKVLSLKYDIPLPPIVKLAHMLGHYASTRYILSIADIANILGTGPRMVEDVYEIHFADDAKLRFNTPPAGTHRLAVCCEAARRLCKYQFSHLCPHIEDFYELPGWRERVMSNPAIYHVGALYLTGPRDTRSFHR